MYLLMSCARAPSIGSDGFFPTPSEAMSHLERTARQSAAAAADLTLFFLETALYSGVQALSGQDSCKNKNWLSSSPAAEARHPNSSRALSPPPHGSDSRVP